MGAFDEILEEAGVAAEDRVPAIALLQKYPKLETVASERGMRQQDYSRKLDEHARTVRELNNKASELDGFVSQWETWKDSTWDDAHGMTKAEYAAQQRVQELEQQVEAGGDMDFNQIEQELTKKGFLRKDDLKPAIDEATRGLATERQLGGQVNGMSLFYSRTANVPLRYQKQFGEEIDMDAFVQFAGRSENIDKLKTREGSDEVYREFVAGRENDIKLAEAIKRADDAEKRLRDRSEQTMGQHSPTSVGGQPPVGRIKQRVLARAQGQKPEPLPGKLGDGTTAILAGEKAARGEYLPKSGESAA